MRRIVVACVLAAGPAAADPLDELGFGAAATGMAGARTALAVGAESIHRDPSGVALAERPELLVGWQYTRDRLQLDGHDANLLDAHGTSIGLAVPFAIHKLRVGAGIAVYLPDQFLARVQLTPISEPHFVRFESATHRAVVEPVIAVATGDWSFGAGVSLLADARSRELRFDVGVVGGSKQGEARLDIALPVRAAPLAGVRWRPSPLVDLSASFRGSLSLDLDLDIVANIDVPNVVTGDATVTLRSVSYFTPMRATVAAAVHPRADLTVTADLTFERWSALGSGVPDLRVLLALDIAPPLVDSMQPAADFHDTITPRLGAEWRTGSRTLRAGAGYLPSPVPDQTGITSFADGARVLATAGAGLRIEPNAILVYPIDLDVAIGWQHVAHALVRKDATLQPGGAFSSGGDLFQASASATVRF
ncbi:MAG: outer membrane protein transport protein [Kofleriaceae bacterium]